MGKIESVLRTGEHVLALPPQKLRGLDWPSDVRVPMRGDALEIHRPDGSVVSGTVGQWGVHGRMEGNTFVTSSDPADPDVSVMIAGIGEVDLWPGSEILIQAYPVAKTAEAS